MPSATAAPPFAVDSFHDVLSGNVPAIKFADKVILIGATAASVGNLFVTPISAAIVAHTTSSILNGHFIAQPAWANLAALGLLLLVAGYVLALLPRLTAAQGAATTGPGFVSLLGLDTGCCRRPPSGCPRSCPPPRC